MSQKKKKNQDKSVKSAIFIFISITLSFLRGLYFGICRNWFLGGAGGPGAEMLLGAGGSRGTDILGLDTTSTISPFFLFSCCAHKRTAECAQAGSSSGCFASLRTGAARLNWRLKASSAN